MNEFDLGRATARAWSRFQVRLADHLVEMVDNDTLVVAAETAVDEEDGAAPYVQFCACGEDQVRCEAVSNDFLAREYHLDDVGTLELLELGYGPPDDGRSGSPNFFVDLPLAEADRAAVMAVRALRDVFGVPHPAFLTSQELPPDDEEDVDLPVVEELPPEEADARYPHEGSEQLRQYVDEAMTTYLGHEPVHDEDGDIPVELGPLVLFVRVLERAPIVRVFTLLVSDVEDLDRARIEVGILNREVESCKFVLLGDSVVASIDVQAWPFAPQHLRAAVARMSEVLGRVHADLALRLGVVDEDSDEEAEMHPALSTLYELEADAPGTLDGELVAKVCGMDSELILSFIHSESVGGSGDFMVRLLRRGLRVVIDRAVGADSPVEPGRGTRRLPRRVPDPTLEEVDPDMWQ